MKMIDEIGAKLHRAIAMHICICIHILHPLIYRTGIHILQNLM